MRLSVGLTTIAITMVGCAARGPSQALVAEVGKADVMMSAGCYRCLEEALQIFERLASDPRGPQRARRGAFEAAVLLAVRSKELGLPYETFLMRGAGTCGRAANQSTLGDPSNGVHRGGGVFHRRPVWPGS